MDTETTYSESAKGQTITQARAFKELATHGMGSEDRADFLAECGDKATYRASDVLTWLGY